MRGRNEIHMNEATLTEAVQEYLDRRSVPLGRVKVSGVNHLGTSGVKVITTDPDEEGES